MNSELNKAIEKTCVIITTYSVIPNVKPLFASIESADIQLIIIADNSKDAWITNELKRMIPGKFSGYFHYIKNDNIGKMAGAINKGFEFAKNNAFKLAFLLDDDAIIAESFVRDEIDCYQLFKSNGLKIGVVCPIVANESKSLGKKITKEEYSFIREAITSGILVSIDAWESLSGFNINFPLDYADIYFTRKLHRNGYKNIRINRVLIYQTFGKTLAIRNIRTVLLAKYSVVLSNVIIFFRIANELDKKPHLQNIDREISMIKSIKFFYKIDGLSVGKLFFYPTLLLSNFLKFLVTKNIEYMKVLFVHGEK